MKYNIRLEFNIKSTDFADVIIEASSTEEVKNLALIAYSKGELDLDFYAGDYYDSELAIEFIDDWSINEIP